MKQFSTQPKNASKKLILSKNSQELNLDSMESLDYVLSKHCTEMNRIT